jgi:hypothetical protein
MLTCQLKDRQIVVESGGEPTVRCMTGGADLPQIAGMCIVLRMAGITIYRCAFKNIIDVTPGTCCTGMFAGQFKDR